ncbi:hypothetical protein ACFWNN_28920 [Lentzea sp. NPDC058450]|uniref:hypothetical protein n=1 Tax=Lentzea sp. NPDC058450 TaxID=3346505 RepID=UPI003648F17E
MADRPRVSLDRSGGLHLDDVSVRDVSLVHAEMLTKRRLWMSCYLEGTGVEGDRVTFMITASGNRLVFEVDERPEGTVSVEG